MEYLKKKKTDQNRETFNLIYLSLEWHHGD